jgi:cyclase
MEKKMFYKAPAIIFGYARQLRNNPTPAEDIFWYKMKELFPSFRFKRQHPIFNYIADFYCHKLKLVIELDGSIHNLPEVIEKDIKRQKDLENLGITVLRFTNIDVFNHF